jgi:hypothetical protein
LIGHQIQSFEAYTNPFGSELLIYINPCGKQISGAWSYRVNTAKKGYQLIINKKVKTAKKGYQLIINDFFI